MEKLLRASTIIEMLDRHQVINTKWFRQMIEDMDGLSVEEIEQVLAEEYTEESTADGTNEKYESGGYDNELL